MDTKSEMAPGIEVLAETPELQEAAESTRLNVLTHRLAALDDAVRRATEWEVLAIASNDPIETASRVTQAFFVALRRAQDLLKPAVVERDGKDRAVRQLNVKKAVELQDTLRELSVLANQRANAVRMAIAGGKRGATEHESPGWQHIQAIEDATGGILADAWWLESVAGRAQLATIDPNAPRLKRMRARRALGFRSATVNVHETDFLVLRRLGLLVGDSRSPADIDNALDAFLAAALATAEAEVNSHGDGSRFIQPGQPRTDVWGFHRIRPFLDRMAALVKAHAISVDRADDTR